MFVCFSPARQSESLLVYTHPSPRDLQVSSHAVDHPGLSQMIYLDVGLPCPLVPPLLLSSADMVRG